MKTITVLTATRAEYGLLSGLIKKLNGSSKYDVRVAVTGTHLSSKFGNTCEEIEKDGIKVDVRIPILEDGDKPVDTTKTMANAMVGFGEYFSNGKTDALIVLGDRYETIAVCLVAMNERIPIIHIHGGETTEGAIDEAIRHAITKLSYLHFTSTEEYRKRVIQLGESPDRVFNVGALGVENILKLNLLGKKELANSIGFDIISNKYSVVTFHPVTLENNSAERQCEALLEALDKRNEISYIITKANADSGGETVNEMLEKYASSRKNVLLVASLGVLRYLSSLKYAEFVIGNSSSGIIEAPSFGIPTVNIGDRQKGRIKASSVIDCDASCDSICSAIDKALDNEFRDKCKRVVNPYGKGNTSDCIISAIDDMFDKGINIKKKFYDL